MHSHLSTSQIQSEIQEIISRPRRIGLWLLNEVRWFYRVTVSAGDRFYWDNGFSKAASLAYTTLLSLVPMMALVFGLLASFAASSEHLPEVRRFIFKQFVPSTGAADEVLTYLSSFSTSVASLNILAVAFLVVTSILLINSVEYALNEIWQVYRTRSIANRLAIFCAIIVIGPVLALSAYYFSTFRMQSLFDNIEVFQSVHLTYSYLLPFFIDFTAFFLLFFLVPKAPVKARAAVFGAALTALLFGLAKVGFANYVERFSGYDRIYSTLASIPIFLFWLYIAWMVVLFGAECCYQAQYLPREGKVWKRSILSVGQARLVLAIQSLILVCQAFRHGKPMPNDLELAEKLGCSSVVLKPTLDALERVGILSRGDSRNMPLMLMRAPDQIELSEIRNALFGRNSPELEANHSFAPEMQRLYSILANVDQKSNTSRPVSTLADVIDK